MSRYYVEVPFTGKLMMEIVAESEEAALEIALNTPREELESLESVEYVEVEEDYHKVIVEGNVFHGVLNRRSIKKLEDDQD